MHHFSFECRTKTSAGIRALEHLAFDLSAMGCTKPMVIRDVDGPHRHLIRAFKDADMTLGLAPALPGPADRPDFLRSAFKAYTENGHDGLIALGGQKAADTAKALNIAVTLGPDALKAGRADSPLSPLVYIPTGVKTGAATAGRTRFNARVLVSPFLAPDQALIDPVLLIPDTWDSLADTALACLATGCEVLARFNNPPARAYGSVIIQLAMPVLQDLMDTGAAPIKQQEALQAPLVQAAVMAGYLFPLPVLGRTLGRKIASGTRVSQGQAMLMVLPHILETLAGRDLGRLLLPLAGPEIFSATPAPQQGPAAVGRLRSMVNELYLFSRGKRPRTLEEAGLDPGDIDGLARTIAGAGKYEDISPAVLSALLADAWNGSPQRRQDAHT